MNDLFEYYADRLYSIVDISDFPTPYLILLKLGWVIDGCDVVGAYNRNHAIQLLASASREKERG